MKTEFVFWLIAAIGCVSMWQLVARGASRAEARDRRRRSKNYRRVVSQRQGPAIRLAVKVPQS